MLRACALTVQDGACAVAVWVVNECVRVSNIGDARCVLARVSDKEGSVGQLRALTLTKEHLALHPAERARIEKAGGSVSAEGRLNGRIMVSRSFGDAQFKKVGRGSRLVSEATRASEAHEIAAWHCVWV